jgi:hypothetical protein
MDHSAESNLSQKPRRNDPQKLYLKGTSHMSSQNSNYVEQEDGFYKKTTSTQKGRSPFNKPLRTSTSMNPSLFQRANGSIDWNAYAAAIAKERGNG